MSRARFIKDFFSAIKKNDANAVRELIKIKENDFLLTEVTELGSTPLCFAVQFNSLDVVDVLLEQAGVEIKQTDVDINKTSVDVNQTRNDGVTPLMIAAQLGHFEAALKLLEKGAAVNKISDSGATALMVAKQKGNLRMVARLLTATFDWLMQADVKDVTPLMIQQLKPYKRQLFERIKELPAEAEQKKVAAQIFDESKPDKKNIDTVFGKIFCQGDSNVDRLNTQLSDIYSECVELGFIKPSERVGKVRLTVFGSRWNLFGELGGSEPVKVTEESENGRRRLSSSSD